MTRHYGISMRAKELIEKYAMEEHVENGKFIERHYEHTDSSRAASGTIYYYVSPGEKTEFHRIDCDEYWVYNAGETIELWVINNDKKLELRFCGITDNAEPCVRFAAGEIFASKLPAGAKDGCFVSCITVPRFSYEGFELIAKEEMLQEYPEMAGFWERV